MTAPPTRRTTLASAPETEPEIVPITISYQGDPLQAVFDGPHDGPVTVTEHGDVTIRWGALSAPVELLFVLLDSGRQFTAIELKDRWAAGEPIDVVDFPRTRIRCEAGADGYRRELSVLTHLSLATIPYTISSEDGAGRTHTIDPKIYNKGDGPPYGGR